MLSVLGYLIIGVCTLLGVIALFWLAKVGLALALGFLLWSIQGVVGLFPFRRNNRSSAH